MSEVRFPNYQSDPAAAIPVWVAGGGLPIPPGAVYLGYQQITADAVTPVGLTVPAGATVALVQADGANFRYLPGDTPAVTSSTGLIIWNTAPPVPFSALDDAQFIVSAPGTTGKLNVVYYGDEA